MFTSWNSRRSSMQGTHSRNEVRGSPSRNYSYRPVLRDPQGMANDNDSSYLNATYHSARQDGNISDTSSVEDLVVDTNIGVISMQEHYNDSELLIAMPKSRRQCSKYSMWAVIAGLALLCFVLAALLFTKSTPRIAERRYCISSGCIDAASYMRNSLNTAVDPCQDFYEYACGGWARNNPIPDGKSTWSIASIIWRKNLGIMKQSLEGNASTDHISEPGVSRSTPTRALTRDQATAQLKSRLLYKTCMDDEQRARLGSQPLKAIIKYLGGFIDADGISVASRSNRALYITSRLVKARRDYALSPLFASFVAADDHNSSQNVIKLKQSGIGLLPVYYTNASSSRSVYLAYKEYMVKLRHLLGDDANTSRLQMNDVLRFEASLAQIFVAMENISEPFEAYEKIKLFSLQKVITQVNWVEYYKGIFDGRANVIEDEKVVLQSSSYFHKLASVIDSYPLHVIHNHIVWKAVSSFAPFLTDEFSTANKPLILALEGAYEMPKRWKFCTTYVDSAMGLALGSMFIERAFSGSSKQEASDMVEEIRLAFESRLPSLEWMDAETKQAAADKAKLIIKKIGFPSLITDQEKLDDHYAMLVLDGKDFFSNHLKVLHRQIERNDHKLHKPVDKSVWEMTAPQVNAYYNPTANEIVFPAGILQPPFYRKDFPRAVNFGGIGAVIGHELLHAFDNTGRRYDKYGNSGKQWWTNSSILSFERKTQCFIDEYSHLKIMGKPINGKLTLGENLADNGGLQAALQAYHHWTHQHGEELPLPSMHMDNLQVFFTAYAQSWCYNVKPLKALFWLNADVHSPNKDRVLGSVSNMPEFAKAFGCATGRPMNKPTKCTMW